MKIRIWLTIFVLSFSLAAMAEAPVPDLRISELRFSGQLDAPRIPDSRCFTEVENLLGPPGRYDPGFVGSMPSGFHWCPRVSVGRRPNLGSQWRKATKISTYLRGGIV
ncbi:MAG: hypothetical protein C5B49_15045 [Bdellovibrio sp.]|nr:MAG: hypothetical protein C5B49_15045 [Bdellovibrio sp.]